MLQWRQHARQFNIQQIQQPKETKHPFAEVAETVATGVCALLGGGGDGDFGGGGDNATAANQQLES
jgi:hypothetical protein